MDQRARWARSAGPIRTWASAEADSAFSQLARSPFARWLARFQSAPPLARRPLEARQTPEQNHRPAATERCQPQPRSAPLHSKPNRMSRGIDIRAAFRRQTEKGRTWPVRTGCSPSCSSDRLMRSRDSVVSRFSIITFQNRGFLSLGWGRLAMCESRFGRLLRSRESPSGRSESCGVSSGGCDSVGVAKLSRD